MDEYDFFDENAENGSENSGERIPTPLELKQNGDAPPYKLKRKFAWRKLVTAIAVGVLVFFFGWLGCWLTLDKEIRTLLGVKKRVQERYYEEITDEEFYDAVFEGINDGLLDPYSAYMSAEKFAEYMRDMQGDRVGVGLVFSAAAENPLKIARVCSGSPAENAGIVRGETVKGLGATAENITPCAKFEELEKLLDEYAAGQEFYLSLENREGETRTVLIHKAEYNENLLFYQTKDAAYTFIGESAQIKEEGSPLTYLDADTAYIQILSFTGNAGAAFDKAMAQFKTDGKKNLVLDLRGNGGGYLDIMQSIGSYFCKEADGSNPVVAVADYGNKKVEYVAKGNYYWQYFSEESKIRVLADDASASASECLLGCMLDYGAIDYENICLIKRGKTAKTYGKGIMQETHVLNVFEQNALKLTTAKIRWPKGNCIHGVGITEEDGAQVVAESDDFDIETKSAIEKVLS